MPTRGVCKRHWDEVPVEQVSETLSRQLITGEREMLARIVIKKGGVVPVHDHEAEQLSYVISGALQFEIGGETIVVGPGEVLTIPSHVPHGAVALEDTLEFDVFSPIRHDWINKTDAYLRR